MGNFRLKIVLTVIMLVFSILPAVIVGTVGTFSVMNYESSAKQNTLRQVAEAKSAGINELFTHYINSVTASSKLVGRSYRRRQRRRGPYSDQVRGQRHR